MNKVDFSKFKIRASAMPAVMTSARNAGEVLSETCKDALIDYWLEAVWDRKEADIKSKFTEKGIACESDSLDLIHKVTNQLYFKNQKTLENDWVKGTPDIITEDTVIDVKTSWSFKTFKKTDEKKALASYNYQLQTYMWLTGLKKSRLVFCLVNTPEEIINDDARRASYTNSELETSDAALEQFRKNYIFDDVPNEIKLKSFDIEFDETFPDKAQSKVFYAREFLATL